MAATEIQRRRGKQLSRNLNVTQVQNLEFTHCIPWFCGVRVNQRIVVDLKIFFKVPTRERKLNGCRIQESFVPVVGKVQGYQKKCLSTVNIQVLMVTAYEPK